MSVIAVELVFGEMKWEKTFGMANPRRMDVFTLSRTNYVISF